MKFKTNFSRPVGRYLPYFTATLVTLSVALCVFSIFLVFSARSMEDQNLLLQEQLEYIQPSGRETVVSVIPSVEELYELREKVQSINKLTYKSGISLPLLLYRIEELLPSEASVMALQYRVSENECRLVVVARGADILTEFMGKLEKSGSFTQVMLTRQTRVSDSANDKVQFEIQLKVGV